MDPAVRKIIGLKGQRPFSSAEAFNSHYRNNAVHNPYCRHAFPQA